MVEEIKKNPFEAEISLYPINIANMMFLSFEKSCAEMYY